MKIDKNSVLEGLVQLVSLLEAKVMGEGEVSESEAGELLPWAEDLKTSFENFDWTGFSSKTTPTSDDFIPDAIGISGGQNPRSVTAPDNPGLKIHLRVMQDRLTEIVDGHIHDLQASLTELGCGGDCYSCPNPEGFSETRFQVGACLKTVVDSLDLDRRYYTDNEENEEDHAESEDEDRSDEEDDEG